VALARLRRARFCRARAGSQGRGFAAWPVASRPLQQQAAGLGSQGGFAACGFAATHGRMHVPTTINIEMLQAIITY